MRCFSIQTVSRAALASPQLHIQTVPEGVSTVVKRPGRDADYSLPSEDKIEGTRIAASDPIRAPKSFNPLTPNDPYRGRTAPLTSKRCILYIYSTNIGTEYFKHGIYSPFFSLKMQFVS